MKNENNTTVSTPDMEQASSNGSLAKEKAKRKIHEFVFMSTQYEKDSQTLTVSPQKRQLMDLSMPDYLKMIRPSTSKKSATAKKKASRKKRLLR